MSRDPVARLACAVIVIAALAGASLPARAADTGGSMQAAEIVDSQGFGQAIPAAALQIPAGWRGRGGVNWNRGTACVSNQMGLEWTASSPDGLQAFEIMHGFGWQILGTQNPMNPCPALPFDSAQAFLRAVVQQRRVGARVLEYRNRPEFAQAAAKAARPHPQARVRHDSGQLFISYQLGGQEVHEVLATLVTFSEMGGNTMGSVGQVTTQRAPKGKLDLVLFDRISASIKANPHWSAMAMESIGNAEKRFSSDQRRQIEQWHASEMAKINAKGAADRAAIRAQTSREVNAINAQTYSDTQATNDRMHRRNLEAVGEYNTYRDSSGNAVRSSIHGGDRVLRLPDGGYTSTRNPYYQPPGSEELKRVR